MAESKSKGVFRKLYESVSGLFHSEDKALSSKLTKMSSQLKEISEILDPPEETSSPKKPEHTDNFAQMRGRVSRWFTSGSPKDVPSYAEYQELMYENDRLDNQANPHENNGNLTLKRTYKTKNGQTTVYNAKGELEEIFDSQTGKTLYDASKKSKKDSYTPSENLTLKKTYKTKNGQTTVYNAKGELEEIFDSQTGKSLYDASQPKASTIKEGKWDDAFYKKPSSAKTISVKPHGPANQGDGR